MSLDSEIVDLLMTGGAKDVGMARIEHGPAGLKYALVFVVPLSESIIAQIEDSPTFSYFHHYRTINMLIDQLALKVGLLLQDNGYMYMPIAASQSQPRNNQRTHRGLYSHKKAAVLSGLGSIGKSALFLHKKYGARVRLGTVFTDYKFDSIKKSTNITFDQNICGNCDLCQKACPAEAIKGNDWSIDCERESLVDPWACNDYMRKHFMKIGRGSVCGICISVCPYSK